jgi:hypothetical protein
MFLLAKYNTQTDFYFPMVKRGVVDLSVTADWTPATGDTKVSKDGGAVANTTNNPAIASGTSWKLTLTASELSAKWITVQIVDAATKAVEDQFLTILTYGNASAFFIAPDFQDAVRFGLTALPNANAEAAGGLYTRGSGAGQINQNANGQVDARAVALSSGVITEAAYDTTAGAFQHLGIVDQGTAQGATGTTLQVRAGAPFADSTQAGATIWAFGSTQGYWQERVATGYVGATKTFTVDAWTVTPSGTITYIVFGTPPNSSVGTVGANVTQWNGTNVAVPATAGVPDVNVKNVNNVSAAAVTTVNANQGTTQPVNFTGAGASALVKSDTVDIAGAAVSTSTAQIAVNRGADVLGTALTETAGSIAAAFKKLFNVAAPTAQDRQPAAQHGLHRGARVEARQPRCDGELAAGDRGLHRAARCGRHTRTLVGLAVTANGLDTQLLPRRRELAVGDEEEYSARELPVRDGRYDRSADHGAHGLGDALDRRRRVRRVRECRRRSRERRLQDRSRGRAT